MPVAISNSGTPVGSVINMPVVTAPVGYILYDGSAISRTTFASLFTVIGITHGSGNGTTTFNLPDYRGRLLRGVDGAASRDPDKAARTSMAAGGNTGNNVGSVQGHATARNGLTATADAHTHSTIAGINNGQTQTAGSVGIATTNSVLSTPGANDVATNQPGLAGRGLITNAITPTITVGVGDNETRPVNAYTNFFIKT